MDELYNSRMLDHPCSKMSMGHKRCRVVADCCFLELRAKDLVKIEPTSKERKFCPMERNALALAIVPFDDQSAPNAAGSFSSMNGMTCWDLALVTAPSSNETPVTTTELGGRLNKLTQYSLYGDAIRRANYPTSYNPWEMPPVITTYMQPVVHDPFYALNAVAAPHHMQMVAMAQQQQALMLQQMMMMMMGQKANQASMNPFGNPYGSVGMHQYGSGMPVQASNTYTGLI